MRVVIPQITWHSRDPVLSVDFDPTSKGEDGFYRLASGGGDCQLLVWNISVVHTFHPEVHCVAEVKRHEKPVNVVRFSPDGTFIASGGDDAYLILWKFGGKLNDGKEENWLFEKSLRKHIEDVSDLSWSSDGTFLMSASIDNTAVLWDVKKGVAVHVWSEKEHNGFVHGVAFDPLNEFAATICIDRTLRLFDLKTNKLSHKALKYPNDWVSREVQDALMEAKEKENLPSSKVAATDVQETNSVVKKKPGFVNRLFHDEFLQTFSRRLCFSPRGELLLVPSGMLPPGQTKDEPLEDADGPNADITTDDDPDKKKKIKSKANNAVVVFCRHSWTNPCAIIPTLESYSISTRFCPVYYQKFRKPYSYDQISAPKKSEKSFASIGKLSAPPSENFSIMKMPYRLVYAVATNDSVLIGDTASSEPLAVVRSIHLARITDITWAANGQVLVVSSTDGYCSIITFEKEELGDEFCVEGEGFPGITQDCFPIMPPEPKKEKDPKKNKPPRIYPMTPPAKPIAVKRGPKTNQSSLASFFASPNSSQKRKNDGDVTPEELLKLKTAPIKYRKLLDEPELIMQSLSRSEPKVQVSTQSLRETPLFPPFEINQPVNPPKVIDPSSPISSATSTPRPPRRITLTTLDSSSPSSFGKLE